VSSFVKDKIRRARKKHKCCACPLPIPKGFEYVVSSQVDKGKWSDSKWHTECRAEFGRMIQDFWDEGGFPCETWYCEEDIPFSMQVKYLILGGENV
jgi:hypothetical protein